MKTIKKKYFFLLIVTTGFFLAYFLLSNHFNQLKFKKALKNKKNLQGLILASQKLKKTYYNYIHKNKSKMFFFF